MKSNSIIFKKSKILLAIIVAIGLFFVTSCDSFTTTYTEVLGSWDNDTIEMSLSFTSDGTFIFSSYDSSTTGTYTYDNTTGTITAEWGEGIQLGYVDEVGNLTIDGYNGVFTSVSTPWYVPSENESNLVTELSGTWDNDTSLVSLSFYENGECALSDVNGFYDGTYTLDTITGDIVIDIYGYIHNGILDAFGDIYIADYDGIFVSSSYAFYAPIDAEVDEDDDVIDDNTDVRPIYIENSWDNDEMKASIIFYSDLTFVWSNEYDEFSGTYFLDEAARTITISYDNITLNGFFDDEDFLYFEDNIGAFYISGIRSYMPLVKLNDDTFLGVWSYVNDSGVELLLTFSADGSWILSSLDSSGAVSEELNRGYTTVVENGAFYGLVNESGETIYTFFHFDIGVLIVENVGTFTLN